MSKRQKQNIVKSSEHENNNTVELQKNSSTKKNSVKPRFNITDDTHLDDVSIQILNIEFTIKEENEFEHTKIVEYLKNFYTPVKSYYIKSGFKRRLENTSYRDDLFHTIREAMEFPVTERTFGEFFNEVFSEINEDDSMYDNYIGFLELLSYNHIGIFQYLAGRGYIDEYLF